MQGIPGDKGQLQTKVFIHNSVDHDDLVIDFGEDVSWIALHKQDVQELIKNLQEKMAEMR